jgi:hypothetical protein
MCTHLSSTDGMRVRCSRFQWQVIDWNDSAIQFYTQRLGARERLETNDAKWLNMIMDRPAIGKFLAS